MTLPLDTRLRYARAMRAVTKLETAADLLIAYEESLPPDGDGTDPLSDIEQLPDWRYATLVQHALTCWPLSVPVGAKITAAGIQAVREMRMLGKLAHATELAIALEDNRTASLMWQLLQQFLLRSKGEGALLAALKALAGATETGAPDGHGGVA